MEANLYLTVRGPNSGEKMLRDLIKNILALCVFLSSAAELCAASNIDNCGNNFLALSSESQNMGTSTEHPNDWPSYGLRWFDNLRRGFDRGNLNYRIPRPYFVQALETGDPRLEPLRNLGFIFSISHKELSIRVPTFSEFHHRYEALLQKHIREGKITEADTIRPGRAFKDGEGRIHIVGLGTNPKNDWKYQDPSGDESLLTRMLREGYFPLSDNYRALHDTGHLASFIEHPEYMKRLRALSSPKKPGENRISGSSRFFSHAFIYYLEGMVLVAPTSRQKILPLLSEPIRVHPNKVPTVSELETHLRAVPEAELFLHAQALIKALPPHFTSYGHFEVGAAAYNIGIHTSLATLVEDVDAALSRKPELLPKVVARLEVAAWLSSRVSLEDVLKECFYGETGPQKPFYQMIVTSELGSSLSPIRTETTSRKDPLYEGLRSFGAND